MKTLFTFLLMIVVASGIRAQIFSENFGAATPGSNMEGYNDWYVCFKSSDALGVSPVIAEGSLSYTGYAGSAEGNTAVLNPAIGDDATTQRISTKMVMFGENPLRNIVGERIYAAFLVNVSDGSKTGTLRDFITFEGSASSSMTRGRVFARVTPEGALNFGLSKNTGTASLIIESSPDLFCDNSYLLVLVYEGIEGDNNDVVTLYINPDLSKSEAEQTNKIVATDVQSDYSETANLGINLRQRAIGAKIGGIRVGRSWDAVLNGVPNSIANTASIDLMPYFHDNFIKTGESGSIKVYNLTGSEIFSGQTNGAVNVNLNRGLYVVRFMGLSGNVTTAKILAY